MLSHQSPQLESVPQRSPFTPADESYLTETVAQNDQSSGQKFLGFTSADECYLQETLVECRVKLESALTTAQRYSRLPDLAVALSDALTGCHEALAVINDPKTYQE
jgi:hypothetical protein